jgi:dihydrofolate reductase
VASLVYPVITSLDGYVVDADGSFAWAEPDEEVHAFVNASERSIGTYLLGRRLYEVMRPWDTMPMDGATPVMRDFAELWRAADKVVYSTTLGTVSTARTRLESVFDPEAVRRAVEASEHDVSVAGPTLAAHAVRAGIVDVWHQLVCPVVVGGGTHWLPPGVRVDLDLVEERRFASGVVSLRYVTRR